MNDNAMNDSEVLKVGTAVEISILSGGRATVNYPGYIRDLAEHGVINLGLPSLVEDDFSLTKGDGVKVVIAVPDGLYSFQGSVLESETGFFTINRPARLDRLERREYGRYNTKVPVVFKEKGGSICKGHTGDLSGGGALLMTENELRVGGQIELQFILPKGIVGNSIYGEIKRKMVVYRPMGEGRTYIYGINFVQINDEDRKKILNYLSEISRLAP